MCVGFTGMSLPLVAEAGLLLSVWEDRERVRSSSKSSSCSLASSKFMLSQRPGERRGSVVWGSFNYTRRSLQILQLRNPFIQKQKRKMKPRCSAYILHNKRTSVIISFQGFLQFWFKTLHRRFYQFFGFICGLWYMRKNSQEVMQYLGNSWSKK